MRIYTLNNIYNLSGLAFIKRVYLLKYHIQICYYDISYVLFLSSSFVFFFVCACGPLGMEFSVNIFCVGLLGYMYILQTFYRELQGINICCIKIYIDNYIFYTDLSIFNKYCIRKLLYITAAYHLTISE